jgi:hypothetical protein
MKELQEFWDFIKKKYAIGELITILTAIPGFFAIFLGTIGAAIALISVLSVFFIQYKKHSQTPALLNQNDDEIQSEAKPQNREKSKPLPPLLPYLPNLSAQEDKLFDAISQWHQNDEQRPFIYLVCGSTKDDGQLEERWKQYLSALLSVRDHASKEEMYLYSEAEIKLIYLTASQHFHNETDLYEAIWKTLRKKCLPSHIKSNWKEKIARDFVDERRALFIYAMIDMTQWQNQNRTINEFIRKFIYFWYDHKTDNAWMAIPGLKYPIIICLFFKYDHLNLRNLKYKKSLFPKKGLDFEQFQAQYQANGVVLPPLSGIKKNDVVDDWIKEYEKTISSYCSDIETMKNEISKLYQWRRTIPLGKLGKKLQKILQNR